MKLKNIKRPMKNQSLKNLAGATVSSVIAEHNSARERVSGYSDTRREMLVESARGVIHGNSKKTTGRAGR